MRFVPRLNFASKLIHFIAFLFIGILTGNLGLYSKCLTFCPTSKLTLQSYKSVLFLSRLLFLFASHFLFFMVKRPITLLNIRNSALSVCFIPVMIGRTTRMSITDMCSLVPNYLLLLSCGFLHHSVIIIIIVIIIIVIITIIILL